MFVSFFPQPRLFFLSAAAWSIFLVLVWFFGGAELGALFGLPPAGADAPPIIGVSVFWSPPFIWFYIYFALAVGALRRFLALLRAASLVDVGRSSAPRSSFSRPISRCR